LKMEDEHLFKQVFSVVILALLLATFYMLAISGMGKFETAITPMLLIVIAVICLSIMSELSRIGCMLSNKRK
jgi:hypothetical protein